MSVKRKAETERKIKPNERGAKICELCTMNIPSLPGSVNGNVMCGNCNSCVHVFD